MQIIKFSRWKCIGEDGEGGGGILCMQRSSDKGRDGCFVFTLSLLMALCGTTALPKPYICVLDVWHLTQNAALYNVVLTQAA